MFKLTEIIYKVGGGGDIEVMSLVLVFVNLINCIIT